MPRWEWYCKYHRLLGGEVVAVATWTVLMKFPEIRRLTALSFVALLLVGCSAGCSMDPNKRLLKYLQSGEAYFKAGRYQVPGSGNPIPERGGGGAAIGRSPLPTCSRLPEVGQFRCGVPRSDRCNESGARAFTCTARTGNSAYRKATV